MRAADLTPVAHYGKVAQAMAAAYAQRPQHGEHSGRMQCPKCGSSLRFTVMSNGLSRGQCIAAGCIRWSN